MLVSLKNVEAFIDVEEMFILIGHLDEALDCMRTDNGTPIQKGYNIFASL